MLVYLFFFKGRGLRFGRSLVQFTVVSGNLENVKVTEPTVHYSKKQRSIRGSMLVDGKMERNMYVFDKQPYTD